MKLKLIVSFAIMIAVVFVPILVAEDNELFYEVRANSYTSYQSSFIENNNGAISLEKLEDENYYLYIGCGATCYTIDSIIVVGTEILVRLKEGGDRDYLIRLGIWDYMSVIGLEVDGRRIYEFTLND